MGSSAAVCFLLLVCLQLVHFSYSLKCHTCGKYVESAGSIIPCQSEPELKECSNLDHFCLKFVNKGIVVRQCVPKCDSTKTSAGGDAEFYCCQEDGCNGSPCLATQSVAAVTLGSLLAAILSRKFV